MYYKDRPHEEYVSLVKGGGEGGDPFEPSSPSSENGGNDISSKKSSHVQHKPWSHKPFLKLDVKFGLLVYDGKLNVEKLDNWVKQIEFYYKSQIIKEETKKI
jgi:hypothetical protein